MGRYIGPKSKKERRIGERLLLKGIRGASPKDSFLRRSYAPGIHGPKGTRRRLSEYGVQLKEKQKAKLIYGIMERQFRKYFDIAVRSPEETGSKMLGLLERRLDNVVFRGGFASSRNQARQLVNHAHIQVNGKKMSIPSYSVKKGDVITVRQRSKNMTLIVDNAKLASQNPYVSWIDVQPENLQITVLDLPTQDDLDVGIEARQIVEFYSK